MSFVTNDLAGILALAKSVKKHFGQWNDTSDLDEFKATLEILLKINHIDCNDADLREAQSAFEARDMVELLTSRVCGLRKLRAAEFAAKCLNKLDLTLVSNYVDKNTPTGYGPDPLLDSPNASTVLSPASSQASTMLSIGNSPISPNDFTTPFPIPEVQRLPTPHWQPNVLSPDAHSSVVPSPIPLTAPSHTPEPSGRGTTSPFAEDPFGVGDKRPKGFSPYGNSDE